MVNKPAKIIPEERTVKEPKLELSSAACLPSLLLHVRDNGAPKANSPGCWNRPQEAHGDGATWCVGSIRSNWNTISNQGHSFDDTTDDWELFSPNMYCKPLFNIL